jgi:hydrogenase nickel incorporation protein HypA/HybF
MHESSLGRDIVRLVVEKAREAEATRVKRVTGFIAETEWLNPEAIVFHFQAHAQGTIAEGAQLELATLWIEADCANCGIRYKPDHHVLLCPQCGSIDAKLSHEPGLRIESIEVE